MLRVLIFEVVQLGVSTYAIWRGGVPERIVAIALLVAAWLSLGISALRFNFATPLLPVLVLDAALFGLVIAVALRANRFWPLWAAALQLVALGTHGVRAYDAEILPVVYARGVGEIAYPICLALTLGTYHFRRRWRLQRRRPEDWSIFRW